MIRTKDIHRGGAERRRRFGFGRRVAEIPETFGLISPRLCASVVNVALCLLVASAAWAQPQIKTAHEMDSGSGVLASGIALKYRTVVEPPLNHSAFLPMGGAFRVSGDTMQHFIYDNAAQSYFGYEMVVTPAGTNRMQISIGPLTVTEQLREVIKAVAGDLPLTPAAPPKYPGPQTVADGDIIALDLMVSPDGRERIVDYIQLVSTPKSSPPPPAATAEPRDFTIDDGPVRFSIQAPEVFIDGRKFPGTVVMYPARSGATLWYYFPGQGRYILSLAPHDGFVKAGVVRAKEIAFQADGHEYQIRLDSPLAGVRNAWNLYVLRDAAYLPLSTLVKLVVGSADRLENLLPKR